MLKVTTQRFKNGKGGAIINHTPIPFRDDEKDLAEELKEKLEKQGFVNVKVEKDD